MEDWLKGFYTQTDPVKRQQLLLENTREMEKEADQLRKQLFEARYVRESHGRMRLWAA